MNYERTNADYPLYPHRALAEAGSIDMKVGQIRAGHRYNHVLGGWTQIISATPFEKKLWVIVNVVWNGRRFKPDIDHHISFLLIVVAGDDVAFRIKFKMEAPIEFAYAINLRPSHADCD